MAEMAMMTKPLADAFLLQFSLRFKRCVDVCSELVLGIDDEEAHYFKLLTNVLGHDEKGQKGGGAWGSS